MPDFSNGVATPAGASYMAPLLNFSNFSNWAADDPYAQKRKEQEQQLNAERIKQAQQQEQITQQQIDLGKAFPQGLPIDPRTGQVDYAKAAQVMAKFGDVGNAVTLLGQQPAPLSPMFSGAQPQGQPQGQPGQPASVPAKPLPPPAANSPQGDSGDGTLTSIVTAKLPDQNQTTGQTIMKIAEVMGVDPNAQLTPGQQRRAQGLLAKYAPEVAGTPSADAGTLPPSANAASPAPKVTRAPASAAAPASGAPVAPPPQPVAPQPAPPPQAVAPAPAAPQGPITPQVPLPKGFSDPQAAILALRAEAARLSGNPKAKGQVDELNNWAERIETSIKPVETHPGTTFRDPRTGQILFREPSATQSRQASPEVIDRIAEGIASGQQPPSLTGLYSNSGPVRAALQERGFDLSKANLEWTRAQKQVASLNGPQMTRFVGLATSVDKTIDEVRELSEQMQNSGIPFFNRKKLEGYMQLEGNSEKGQLAARYIGAVNTLKEEFANLAQGGYAPTEAVWELANKQINGDYGFKQMAASLDEVQRLIRYRVNAIPNINTMGPGAADRYTGGGGPAAPAAAPAAAASAASGGGWTTLPNGARIREKKADQ